MFSKRWLSVILCLVFWQYWAQAQQEPNMAHYMYAPAVFNPSMTATDDALSVTGTYRLQWVGFPGNPETEWLSIQSPLSKHFGGGIEMSNDQLGVLRNTAVSLAGSYFIPLKNARLSIGLQAGAAQQSLDGSKLTTPDGDYTSGQVNHNDPHIPSTLATQFQPDAAAGVSYISHHFTIGLSAQHLLSGLTTGVHYFQFTPAYYLNAQYRKTLNKTWAWQLGGLWRYDGAKMQTDLTTIFIYKNIFWLGGGLRGYNSNTLDAAGLYAGVQVLPHVIAGYAYEAGLSSLQSYQGGSHEVMVRYSLMLFQPPKPGKVIFTPRF